MAKIVFFHMAHWDQLLGGAELQLSYMVEHYLKNGDEVHVIYIDMNGKPVFSRGECLHRVTKLSLTGFFGNLNFLHIPQVISLLKRIEPEVIVTMTASSIAGACAKYAAGKNIKHVHFLASDDDIRALAPRFSIRRPFNFLEEKIYVWILNKNTKLMSQNSFQETALFDNYGLPSSRWATLLPMPEEAHFDKADDVFHVVWVANLKVLKRPEFFVEIASYYQGRRDIDFTMIGADDRGVYSGFLKNAETMGNFKYLGKLSNNDVNKVLCRSHVLINTSDYEGFSNTFVQAWMREVVVISFNSNPDQILTKHGVGYVSGGTQETIRFLNHLMNNRGELKAMSARAREYAIKEHSLNNLQSNGYWGA